VEFASAISEHPVTAIATGEVAGAVFEAVGPDPSLCVLFLTPGHSGAFEDVLGTIRSVLTPGVLIAGVAESIVGPAREVEHGPGISLWAAAKGEAHGVRLDAVPDGVCGWPEDVGFDPVALVLLADPFSFAVEEFLAAVDSRHPGMPVVGGMASAGRMAGANRIALDDSVHTTGAVGVLLGPGTSVEPLVSQGCRPFGRPLVVTKATGNVIYELAGKPALERLVAQAGADLSEEELTAISEGGLQVGRVTDEHKETFDTGDFLIRAVLGTDRRTGAVAVGDVMPVGVTVQFQLRDAHSAAEDLEQRLCGKSADAALLFTCTGRGTRLFGGPDHDAGAVADHLGPIPLAGCFASGEIGPVSGRSYLHGFTASLALFRSVERVR
jgi:small ligand-binding sensory domain FIST